MECFHGMYCISRGNLFIYIFSEPCQRRSCQATSCSFLFYGVYSNLRCRERESRRKPQSPVLCRISRFNLHYYNCFDYQHRKERFTLTSHVVHGDEMDRGEIPCHARGVDRSSTKRETLFTSRSRALYVKSNTKI